MALHGNYYYRSRRVGKRVIREYFGCGLLAFLNKKKDELEADEFAAARENDRRFNDQLNALEADMLELDYLSTLLAKIWLVGNGYHQHHRGEWRKQRVETTA